MGCFPSTEKNPAEESSVSEYVLIDSPRPILQSPGIQSKRMSFFGTMRPTTILHTTIINPAIPEDLRPLASEFDLSHEDISILQSLPCTPDAMEMCLGQYKYDHVLIKRLSHGTDDSDLVKEILTMAKLQHENIIRFIGFFIDPIRGLHSVTEFLNGFSLRAYLDDTQIQLTWEKQKSKIALDIAKGMAYLHSRKPKIIHRDITAESVFFDVETQLAKLTGFGSARERSFDAMMSHRRVGTIQWTAPEILYGDDYDERIDVYSFGVVLIELDTRAIPLKEYKDDLALVNLLATGKVRPHVSKQCPPRIARLAHACLQHDASKRPTSFQVVSQLREIMSIQQNSPTDITSSFLG